MGTFAVKFVVSNPRQPDRRVELEGLVDSGAFMTQVPAEVLADLGITPSGHRAVHYADGARAVVPVANADVSLQGIEAPTLILCGRPGSLVLVGALTLEALSLGIDPVHETLVPIVMPQAAASPVRSIREPVLDYR